MRPAGSARRWSRAASRPPWRPAPWPASSSGWQPVAETAVADWVERLGGSEGATTASRLFADRGTAADAGAGDRVVA